MKAKLNGFLTGLLLGAVFGVLVGSAGVVYSAIKKEGWKSQPPAFRLGYIAGFLDVIKMAKTSSRGTYLDNHYRLPPDAKILDWAAEINALYALPEHANAPVAQVMAFAGPRLEKKFGAERVGGAWMKAWAEMAARKREAIAKGEIKPLSEEQRAVRREYARLEAIRTKCKRGCRKQCKVTCDAEVEQARAAGKTSAEPSSEIEKPASQSQAADGR